MFRPATASEGPRTAAGEDRLSRSTSVPAARWRSQCFALLLVLVTACATPAVRIDRRASRWGLNRSLVQGEPFRHVVYHESSGLDPRTLHVYLEGDGLPWFGTRRISRDPTPRRPYALELMALDPAARAYVGRPCYHGLHSDAGCSPLLWTQQRYGTEVVESLEAAIRSVAADHASQHLVLIGYSGGGVLAMLLAQRLESVGAVVTIAANLDTDAWAELHGYSPLQGSLNPARLSPLPAHLIQLHLAGARDRNVPPEIVEAVAGRQPASELRIFPSFDHTCCWLEVWPKILVELRRAFARRTTPR